MRNSLDLCRLSDRLVSFQTALGVNQVRRENSVDERRLSETRLPYILNHYVDNPTFLRTLRPTNDDDIELEATLQELVLDLLGDGVKTDVGSSADFFDCNGGHLQQIVF